MTRHLRIAPRPSPSAARTAARMLAAVLPLTRRGLLLLCLSLLLLGLGVARADMAGIFWGSSFLLACLYAVAGGHITRLLSARSARSPGAFEILLPVAALSPGDEAEARLAVRLPRAFPPGFTVRFSLPLSWQKRSVNGVRTPVHPGENRHTIRFRAGSRGVFRSDCALLEARDILGLVRNPLVLPTGESMRVLPRVQPPDRGLRIREEGGDSVRYASRRRRSEEMLEVRKYFPGDDVRRLNWKVFAHAGELFLRIGEETPPPESRFLFLLDPTENVLVPDGLCADYLDRLVEACASAMSLLLGRGTEILFWCPGAAASRAFSAESRAELLALLAGVWWAEPGWRIDLPGRGGLHAVVFSTPGSPSLERLMAEIARRGWKATLFLPDMEMPPGRRRLPAWRDLLFVPRQTRGRGEAVPESALAAFRDALAQERARYGGAMKGGVDAAAPA